MKEAGPDILNHISRMNKACTTRVWKLRQKPHGRLQKKSTSPSLSLMPWYDGQIVCTMYQFGCELWHAADLKWRHISSQSFSLEYYLVLRGDAMSLSLLLPMLPSVTLHQ